MNVSASPFPDAPARMPLAECLRPHPTDDVIGQQHLLRSGKSLRVAFAPDESHSMTFWGPPRVGKTTLARLIANAFDAEFIVLPAMLFDVKDIRGTAEHAEQFRAHGRHTLILIDEVRRFNKNQQDAFLPHVEGRLFTFIGATTEDPSFEVSGALLSRVAVYVLKSLSDDGLKQLTGRTRQELGGLEWTPTALDAIVASADGDGHKPLNSIEIVTRTMRAQMDGDVMPAVDEALLASALSENLRYFDKDDDIFYDQISALHKSVRGSDPDDALYWFCRILDGGAGPRYLAHRIIRMAWEDVGLTDPYARRTTLDATETYERLDSPEGELALVQTVICLAIAPRSNASYNAYNMTRAFVSQDESRNIPVHLRNTPTRLMKGFGYGHAYRHAHDKPEAYAADETYFPDDLPTQDWYVPTPCGLEDKIGEKLRHLCGLDA